MHVPEAMKKADRYDCLYVSYDGLLEPLGLSQVIPYLKGLSKNGIRIIALSFEKCSCLKWKTNIRYKDEELSGFGIKWIRLRYHKHPSLLATGFDVLVGLVVSLFLTQKYGIKILHARSYVAGLIGLFLCKIRRAKFLFDMRGFWVDERVEAGLWSKKCITYRLARYFERGLLQGSNVNIVLTEAARKELMKSEKASIRCPYITVIPTCVDLSHFKSSARGVKYDFVCLGSVSTWCMPYEIVNFFRYATSVMPDTNFLILTKESEFFRRILRNTKLNASRISIVSASYEEVPDYLAHCKAGLAFYRSGYSRKGCCPTKVGEYLACGLPVIINSGVGDSEMIISGERVGVIIEDFSKSEYCRAFSEICKMLGEEEALRRRCRLTAEKYFSLEEGTKKYLTVYQGLIKK